jgi:hypothetical protein
MILEWTEQGNKRGKIKKEIGRGRYRTKGRKEEEGDVRRLKPRNQNRRDISRGLVAM